MAAVDAKRGYVGMCNGRSAQQESGAALSKNSMFTAGGGPKIIYSYYTRCALIRDQRALGTARVWSGLVQEQHVYGGGQKLYTAIILGVH